MSDKVFIARNGLQVAAGTRFVLPTGNTAQRVAGPIIGELRYNTDSNIFEAFYANGSWAPPVAVSIGGNQSFTTITVGNSTVNSFANSTGIQWQDSGGVKTIVNTVSVSISNGSITTTHALGSISVGANAVLNATSLGIGNSTVSLVANATALVIGAASLNATTLAVTGATLNSSWYTGTSASANNSQFLGGINADAYATTTTLASYQTISGMAAKVATLTANNANYIGGVAAGNVWTTSSLVYITQLNNNAGYITGLSAGGNYSCSTMTAGSYLYSSGNVYAVGDVYASYSDARLKHIHSRIWNPLDKINLLSGIYYSRNDAAPHLGDINDKRRRVGLVAQDVQAVLPEAVGYVKDSEGNDTEYLTVQYERIVPLLVEAIKELSLQVEALKSGIR